MPNATKAKVQYQYEMTCCKCGAIIVVESHSQIKARLLIQIKEEWATTSMDSPTARDICGECHKFSKEYRPGLPFKQSAFRGVFTSARVISALGHIRSKR